MTKIAERASESRLDKPTRFPTQAGLGTGTVRESMEKAVEQGRHIVTASVFDAAAKKKDQEVYERARSKYLLGLSNPNIPLVRDGLEAQARLRAGTYEKPEYRVYLGSNADGGFFVITKTEFDYAQSLMVAA